MVQWTKMKAKVTGVKDNLMNKGKAKAVTMLVKGM